LFAQTISPPKIGIIDFFGLKKVSRDRVEKALAVKTGDPLPRSKGEIEERLEEVNNVVRARLEAVCCEDGQAILYVGILERGDLTFDYRDAPTDETLKLPEEIVTVWDRFMEQLQIAVRGGTSAEDLTNGHSLMAYAPARELQLEFPALADKHLELLRSVLRGSANETERAIAASVIAYTSKKKDIVNDLQFAMQDPDDGVRNNAMRSLGALSVLAKLKPESEIKISATWFVEQLNSVVWSDRNKAAYALMFMTEDQDPRTLGLLKERAVDALADMARWKHLAHALPGFILLGRTAGWEEKRLQEVWEKGTHLAAIDEMVKTLRKKK
jgi:hypothetical protein